jgi:hypothetical protein
VASNSSGSPTISFGGASKTLSTGTNAAITLSTNTGATISFPGGGLDIDTTSGIGLSASGGGTLTVGTGASPNTITTTTGQAIVMTGVGIGAGGASFGSLSTGTVGSGDALSFTSVAGPGAFSGGNVTVGGTGAGGDGIEINGSGAAFSFASATIDATAGAGINLLGANGAVTFTTVDIDNTGTAGLQVTNNSNAVSVNGGTIGATNDPTGNVVDLDQGTGTVTIAAPLTKSTAGRIVEVTGRSGGTVTFSGTLSCTSGCTGINAATNNTGGAKSLVFSAGTKTLNTGANPAITLSSNGGTNPLAIDFTNGGLDVDTTSGAGFSATGGGTVRVQGTNNTITSTTGTALTVANTNIGAAGAAPESGLRFQSIAANGAVNGIVLNTTGSSGGLTVTGDSGGSNNGSGGTIQNTTGAGVSLTSTSNVSLNYMNITGSGDDGISGASVTGFTMNRSNVTNNGNDLNEDGVDFGGSGVITPNGLFGTATVTNSMFTGNYYNQFTIRNNSNTVSLTMTGSTITGRIAENNNNDGLFLEALGTATITGDIQGSTFSANKGDHFQAAATNSGDLNITFKGNTLTGGHSFALGQGITVNAALGVPFGGYSGQVTYDIDGNNFNGAISNSVATVLGTSAATASFTGKIRNNIIGTSGVALSCSTQANGVYVDARGNGTHTSAVTGNTIRQCFDRGILSEAGDGDSVLNLTVTGNTIDQQVGAGVREAIQTNHGITSTNVFGNVDTNVVCLQLGGAGALANTFSHGGGAPDDFRLRKRFEATVRLPGYAGGTGQDAGSLAQVVAFIQGQNTGSAGEPGSAAASGTGGGYTGGSACLLPPP